MRISGDESSGVHAEIANNASAATATAILSGAGTVTVDGLMAEGIVASTVGSGGAVAITDRETAVDAFGSQAAGVSVEQVSGYMNQVATRPMLAEKMATTVTQPSTLVVRLLTRSPMIFRLLVMSRMSRRSGGVENP